MSAFWSYLLLVCFIQLGVYARPNIPPLYAQMASSYCYIKNYSQWMERQASLNYYYRLARHLKMDTSRFLKELEQYRLQRECLRILERLPILIGGG